jgi:hypothetical protein
LAKAFKVSFRITKVNQNGTALIRGKSAKHDNLMKTDLLVKFARPQAEEGAAKTITQKKSRHRNRKKQFYPQISQKRTHTKE